MVRLTGTRPTKLRRWDSDARQCWASSAGASAGSEGRAGWPGRPGGL